MAADDINFMRNLDNHIIGVAKGVGVEFENYSNRESVNFREQMKQKQRNRKKKGGGE